MKVDPKILPHLRHVDKDVQGIIAEIKEYIASPDEETNAQLQFITRGVGAISSSLRRLANHLKEQESLEQSVQRTH